MKRTKPPKTSKLYVQLWRVVDGAVADAFAKHPDYLTSKGMRGRAARMSINKRVVGKMTSFVEKSTRSRPVQNSG